MNIQLYFQENRLKQYRIEQPHNTALLSAELTSVRNLLESKQRELTQSMLKVDKITQALSDLQKTQGRGWKQFETSSSISKVSHMFFFIFWVETYYFSDFDKRRLGLERDGKVESGVGRTSKFEFGTIEKASVAARATASKAKWIGGVGS